MSETKSGELGPVIALEEALNALIGKLRPQHSVYANQINFELNDLDLDFIFGQLSRAPGKGEPFTDWHTKVAMPWAEAKLVSFYLRLNLALYESSNGLIKLPAGMLPATIPTPEDLDTNPASRALFEKITAIRNELMEEQSPMHSKGGTEKPES